LNFLKTCNIIKISITKARCVKNGIKVPHKCPVCGQKDMYISKLQCRVCGTTIENQFEFSKFLRLSEDQIEFVEAFLKNRGNFKEMERELGLSYPTLRSRLENILEVLGLKQEKENESSSALVVLEMLENGEITADEAIKILKEEGLR